MYKSGHCGVGNFTLFSKHRPYNFLPSRSTLVGRDHQRARWKIRPLISASWTTGQTNDFKGSGSAQFQPMHQQAKLNWTELPLLHSPLTRTQEKNPIVLIRRICRDSKRPLNILPHFFHPPLSIAWRVMNEKRTIPRWILTRASAWNSFSIRSDYFGSSSIRAQHKTATAVHSVEHSLLIRSSLSTQGKIIAVEKPDTVSKRSKISSCSSEYSPLRQEHVTHVLRMQS